MIMDFEIKGAIVESDPHNYSLLFSLSLAALVVIELVDWKADALRIHLFIFSITEILAYSFSTKKLFIIFWVNLKKLPWIFGVMPKKLP